jgi:hypothetical protein
MGIFVIDDPSASGFVLCAPRILRTPKFICALAFGPEVISTDFLDECLEKKEMVDHEDFILQDDEGEEKNDVSLEESLERARVNDRKLLKGWQIFCTEKIRGGFDTYKGVVEINGGACYLFKSKTNMKLSKPLPSKNQQNDEDDMTNRLFLISGNSKAEMDLWPQFQGMAEKADMDPMIVKADWILAVAMNQRTLWKSEWAY